MRHRLIFLIGMMCGCVMPNHPKIAGGVNSTIAAFGGSLIIFGGSTSETTFERPVGGIILAAAAFAQLLSMTLTPDPDPAPPGQRPATAIDPRQSTRTGLASCGFEDQLGH